MPAHKHIYQDFGQQPALYPLFVELRTFQDIQVDGVEPDPNRGLFINKQKDRVVLTWNHMIGLNQPHGEYSFQLVLHEQGNIEFNYADIHENTKTNLFYGYSAAQMIGMTPGTQNGDVQRLKFTDNVSIRGA